MMYYGGGAGWLGWVLMGFSMIAFWAVVVAVVLWAVRAASRGSATTVAPPLALGILQERFARGEITEDEYGQRARVILGAAG